MLIAGFVYSVLLGAFLRNRSYARRLLVLSGILGELIAYVITFMNLPDSANLGNTEAKSYLTPKLVKEKITFVFYVFNTRESQIPLYLP